MITALYVAAAVGFVAALSRLFASACGARCAWSGLKSLSVMVAMAMLAVGTSASRFLQ